MAMERIDKIIASQGLYSRSDVKYMVNRKRITIDGKVVTSASQKADVDKNEIMLDGKPFVVKKQIYLMLNKPKGYVSATEDKKQQTVLELVPPALKGRDLFPAGRLDKDTTGLMIITDDGVLAHNILSPKKHVQKIYRVELDIPVTEEMQQGFADGVELNDGVCKDAKLTILGEKTAEVTLREGRYHQIKRMFGCYGAKVVELHRIAMGELYLPDDLPEGQCRELTEEDLVKLQTRNR
ncbi:MAG: 16S rRNA pseudouridine(516) synthase [Anaerotignum sp.]|nr:16S rRNA pseudouridine(516) synthase [Anaerotignum sp.]